MRISKKSNLLCLFYVPHSQTPEFHLIAWADNKR